MEVVPRKRSLFAPDYARLAALVAVSVAVHAWLLAHTAVTARDSLGFARYALNLQSPHATPEGDKPDRTMIDVIKEHQHPPGYPLAVWAAAKVVRSVWAAPHADTTLLATQLVNSLAAVLLVVPTYLIGRMLFDRSVGFAGALLFQTLPVGAQVTADGLTEGVYLLGAAVALMLAVRAARRPGVGGFLLTGLSVGAAYLVRPEAALIAAALGLVALILGARKNWPRGATLGRLIALSVGFALVAGPYMLLIGGISNKPTAKDIVSPGANVNPKEKLLNGRETGAAPARGGGPLFAAWLDDPNASRPVWAVKAVVKETGKTMNYAPAVFAVIGLFLFRRRLAVEPGLAVLVVLVAVNAALLVVVGVVKGYVSERHALLISMIGCIFAAAALEPLTAAFATFPGVGRLWSGRFATTGLLLALVATGLPGSLKSAHQNRVGHKHAGEWLRPILKDHVDRNEAVIVLDPFCWVGWYSGHTLYFEPPHDPKTRVHYAVVERNSPTPHSRLPALPHAEVFAASGKLVYHWPEDVPADRARVHIYKTVIGD
jgi:hypothetical protein